MTTVPIDISYRNGIMPSSFRRESFTQSQGMGGVSWGGMSVGSWLREEVMLNNLNMPASSHVVPSSTRNSSCAIAAASTAISGSNSAAAGSGPLATPSNSSTTLSGTGIANDGHHGLAGDSLEMTPAYFPSMEVNFCRDYSCCGRPLPTLHDLLKHYEESHVSSTPPAETPVPRRVSSPEMVSTNEVFLSSQAQLHGGAGAAIAGGHPHGNHHLGGTGGSSNTTGSNTAGINRHNNTAHPGTISNSHANHHAGGLGGSNAVGAAGHHAAMGLGNSSMQGINIGSGNPGSTSASGHVDVSGLPHHSVAIGLESLHLHAGLGGPAFGSTPHTNGLLAGGMNGLDGHHLAGRSGAAHGGISVKDEDDDLCIDDPARHLYVAERTDAKPYRCPVVGCEKMYKNQNGLKYHRLHGHQNQTLHANEDGTFSIIDPLSNTPYPDGQGMEKDKPYRCEVCGKRYKNLNGLKYHRAHSTH